ncbi:protein SDA1 homolog [Nephila pilipes]|uniref:Protein SDA1 n=1 Tax=Nephila pilipes TaxID=299642 RepID=A0A8X6QG12_NEPPI|nr:protein SDA1 homolog [Nephila pilipes]
MKEKSTSKFTFSILQLQNLAKRDPQSYYEEFQTHYQHFQAVLQLFKFNPHEYNDNFADLVNFLSHVSRCYKEELKDFPDQLMEILRENATVLDPSMRMCLVKALILMRNRDVLLPTDLITLFFELLRCKDKVLRKLLQSHIVSDLKKVNAKHKNLKVNTVLQNFMFKMLADSNVTAARMSLDIMVELYKRNIWRDEKTVNAIATACLAKDNKMIVKAHQFFLNTDYEIDTDDSDSEDDTSALKAITATTKVNKKSRKRQRLLDRAKKALKKSKKQKKNKENCNFAAIHLLHDPLGLAEKLYAYIQKMNEAFQMKILVMNLISRLIGVHELILLNFYPYLTRFLRPHQIDVTKILVCAAQATHEQVPPDVIEPLIKTILFNFVTEKNSSEVITVGINAIKEICTRCPLAIDSDLLHDLAQYEKYRNKNVTSAARSLIRLFREINPKMLHRKYQSRPTEASVELNQKNYAYGALNTKSYIPGTEALSLDPPAVNTVEDEKAYDSDGSWIDVSHSEDEVSCDEEDMNEKNDNKISKSAESSSNKSDDVLPKKSKEKGETCDVADSKKSEEKDKTCDAADSKKNEEKNKTCISDDLKAGKDKAEAISQSRILSQKEFEDIRIAQFKKKVSFAKGKKRKSEITQPDIARSEIVSLGDIEKLAKRPKMDKEARLAAVMEGREGRENYSKKRNTKNPLASKTQKQHNKNKAFMMIKHKVKSKIKRSFRDKQLSLRNALLKRKKQYK